MAEGARVVLGATSDRIHDRAGELGDAAMGVIADLTVEDRPNPWSMPPYNAGAGWTSW